MKFHLPWKKQKHLQRNCRPWYWQSAAKKGLWPAQPAACKKQRRPTGIIYPSPQIIPEQFDHLWRSKSLKRKEKDLLSHTGLFFFPPLLSEFPGVVFGLAWRSSAHSRGGSWPTHHLLGQTSAPQAGYQDRQLLSQRELSTLPWSQR